MRFKRFVMALLIFIGVSFLGSGGTARANVITCDLFSQCGNVYNMGPTNLGVVKDLGPYSTYASPLLPVGRWSNSYYGWADTDAFYIGAGWCGQLYLYYYDYGYFSYWKTVGPGYWKVDDTQKVGVKGVRC